MAGAAPVNPFLSDSEEEEEGDELVAPVLSPDAEAMSPPGGSEAALSPTGPPLLPPPPPGPAEPRAVPLDTLAAQLLREQLLLTALELHTELLEGGRELPRLRDYFSNPGHFERQSGCTPPGGGTGGALAQPGGSREPPPHSAGAASGGGGGSLNRAGSISTLDSLDFARYSDDGNRETDERVVVLEFELRKAKETIQALRANLTQAAENEVPLQERKNYKSSPEIQEPIRPLEKRALNFLVNEYLLQNNYKLTSITFSDENDDQDFELWDDVGLNIPKPPDVLQLYRDFGNHQASVKDVVDIGVCTEDDELEPRPRKGSDASFDEPPVIAESLIIQDLEDQIHSLYNEKVLLLEQIQKLSSEMDSLKREHAIPPFVCNSVQSSFDRVRPQASGDNGEYLDMRSSTPGCQTSKVEEDNIPLISEMETDCRPPARNTLSAFLEKSSETESSPSSKTISQFDISNRKLSPAFHQALLSFCQMSADSRLGSEVSRIADSEQGVMLMLGRCLPHIVPNVLLAKRETHQCILELCFPPSIQYNCEKKFHSKFCP